MSGEINKHAAMKRSKTQSNGRIRNRMKILPQRSTVFRLALHEKENINQNQI
jgi:hypothetical protein